MKLDEYEEFEEKYHDAKNHKQYRSVLQKLPFINTKFNMDILRHYVASSPNTPLKLPV